MSPHLHLAGGAAGCLWAIFRGLIGFAPIVLRAKTPPPPVCGQEHRPPVFFFVHFQDPGPVGSIRVCLAVGPFGFQRRVSGVS